MYTIHCSWGREYKDKTRLPLKVMLEENFFLKKLKSIDSYEIRHSWSYIKNGGKGYQLIWNNRIQLWKIRKLKVFEEKMPNMKTDDRLLLVCTKGT